MKFCIRVDDIGWTPIESDTPPIKMPDIGLELAGRFHAAMGGRPYLGGVIPSHAGPGELDAMIDAGMSPAVHGWDHGADQPGIREEFNDTATEIIIRRLSYGRQALKHSQWPQMTRHYIPPYNAINGRTIAACAFNFLYDVWGGPSVNRFPTAIGDVRIIPATTRFYGALGQKQGTAKRALLEELEIAAQEIGLDPFIVTLHITWEAALDPEFNNVKRLVEQFGESIISPEEYLKEFNL